MDLFLDLSVISFFSSLTVPLELRMTSNSERGEQTTVCFFCIDNNVFIHVYFFIPVYGRKLF